MQGGASRDTKASAEEGLPEDSELMDFDKLFCSSNFLLTFLGSMLPQYMALSVSFVSQLVCQKKI